MDTPDPPEDLAEAPLSSGGTPSVRPSAPGAGPPSRQRADDGQPGRRSETPPVITGRRCLTLDILRGVGNIEKAKPQRSIGFWLGWGVLGAAVLSAVVMELVTPLFGYGWWPWANSTANRPDPYKVVRTGAFATGTIAAAAAAVLAIRRQRSTEQTLEIAQQTQARENDKHASETIARLRERYAGASAQLGNDSPAIRLAGAYAMAALADDWLARDDRKEAQVCTNILCAYIRTQRDHGGSATAKSADLEVRQTIVRIIRDHLRRPDTDTEPAWAGMNFDFTGAVFDEGQFDFSRATFSSGYVNFRSVNFSGGYIDFRAVIFSGGRLDFTNATFSSGKVDFRDATFSGTKFLRGPWPGESPPEAWPPPASP